MLPIATSERHGGPQAELLRGEAWAAAWESMARALGSALDPAVELARLQMQLRATYTEVSEDLPRHSATRVVAGQPAFYAGKHTARVGRVGQPDALREQLAGQLPQVELAALLLEVEAFTGFTSAFTHVADGENKAVGLPRGICAVLVVQACNTGPEGSGSARSASDLGRAVAEFGRAEKTRYLLTYVSEQA